MKTFAPGDRVTIKTGLFGREKYGTVEKDEGGPFVVVVLDEKKKPKPFKRAVVRGQPELRVIVGGPPVATQHPIVNGPPVATQRPAIRPPAPERARNVATREAPLRAVPKPIAPDRDASYTKFVRSHKCCACPANVGIEAHHWAWAGQKGMATKPSDYFTVPLCERCHTHFHRTGELPGKNPAMSRELFRETELLLLAEWARIQRKKLEERRVVR